MSRLPFNGVPLVGKGVKVASITISLYDAGQGKMNIGLESPLSMASLNLILDKVKRMVVDQAGIDLPPPQPPVIGQPSPQGK